MNNKALFVNNVVLLLKNFILIDFMRILRIIVTKGDDSKLSKQNIST
ncbi:STAS/SEC14 domain-containing protein, partial [Bacillus mycoides]